MKKLILVILMLFSLTSCITGGIGIGSDGKVRGNIGVCLQVDWFEVESELIQMVDFLEELDFNYLI